MSTFSDVFAREEKKYRLTARQYKVMLAVLDGRLAPDEFGFSQVRSLYFDTPEFSLIEHSLDKPLYKEKLRVRVYDGSGNAAPVVAEPDDTARVATEPIADTEMQAFVELKKKFKGIVYKRRVSMSLSAARAYLFGTPYEQACDTFPLTDPLAAEQSLSARCIQIAREIDFFRERNGGLVPSMLTVCDRSAYWDPDGSELRITFDENVAAHPHATGLDDTADCRPLTDDGEVIMEIKNAGPLPFWLIDALSACKAYPQTFSKYGTAYMALVTPQEITNVICLPVGEHVAAPVPAPGSAVAPAPANTPDLVATPAPAAASALAGSSTQNAPTSALVTLSKTARGRHARVTERSKTCA